MKLFRTGLGVGDVLLATGILKALGRYGGHKIIVETRFPELFLHNPHVKAIWGADIRARRMEALFGHKVLWRLGSPLNEWFDRHSIIPSYPFPCRGVHLIDAMARSSGVELLPEERRPFVYLTQSELKAQSWAKGWIAVQSGSTDYWTVNKQWVPGRMQKVVDELGARGYQLVQLGANDDEALRGVKNLQGSTSLREAAAVLFHARLFIGLEGGLVHLARAAHSMAVVIYTGYTRPAETGYEENMNLRDPNAGDGCWKKEMCAHCGRSAEAITNEAVVKAVLGLLSGDALPHDVSNKIPTL